MFFPGTSTTLFARSAPVLIVRPKVTARARAAWASCALISLILSSAPARAGDDTAAAQAYQQALRFYEAGNLTAALASMRESHRLSARPELLYNIARLEKELGDCAPALAHYREYVSRAPEGQYRADASRAIEELAASCPQTNAGAEPTAAAAVAAPPATSSRSPAPPTEPPAALPPKSQEPDSAPPSPYWTTQRWAGWSMIAAGALTEAGALGFLTAAIHERDRLQDSVDRARAGGSTVNLSLRDDQHRDQHLAQLLGVTGGALVVGGTLLLLLAPERSQRTQPSAALHIQPGLVSASLSGSF